MDEKILKLASQNPLFSWKFSPAESDLKLVTEFIDNYDFSQLQSEPSIQNRQMFLSNIILILYIALSRSNKSPQFKITETLGEIMEVTNIFRRGDTEMMRSLLDRLKEAHSKGKLDAAYFERFRKIITQYIES